MELTKESYNEFLKKKQKVHTKSGFEVDINDLNPAMFDFQKFIVSRALSHGKYAIFADCGLGKTLMQLEWAHQVAKKNKRASNRICTIGGSWANNPRGRKVWHTNTQV